MSIPLPETDLSMAKLGQVISVDLTQSMSTIPLSNVYSDKVPHITLHNRSGFGLIITMQQSGKRFNLPPNGHTDFIAINRNETSLSVLVNYGVSLGPNSGNRLLGDLYGPLEDRAVIQSTSVDSLSQPRIISIPIVPVDIATSFGFFGTVPISTAKPISNLIAWTAFPNIALNNYINCYLYSLSVQTRNAGWSAFAIYGGQFTAGNVLVPGTEVILWNGLVDGSRTVADSVAKYESPYPLHAALINVGGTSVKFGMFFRVDFAQNPGTNDFWINGTLGFDSQNISVPVDIGNLIRTVGGIVDPGTF